MDTFLFGSLLLVAGLACVHVAVRGWPLLNHNEQQRDPAKRGPAGFGRDDQLLGEVLAEMLELREEVATLKGRLDSTAARRQASRAPKSQAAKA